MFKSTDSGSTWAAANTGLTNLDVYALAIDPTTPATLYAGTKGGGVFRSTDSGGTWAAANTGLTNLDVYALAIDPTTPATLYAGTDGGGVFRSTNSGGTWAAENAGLTNLDVHRPGHRSLDSRHALRRDGRRRVAVESSSGGDDGRGHWHRSVLRHPQRHREPEWGDDRDRLRVRNDAGLRGHGRGAEPGGFDVSVSLGPRV